MGITTSFYLTPLQKALGSSRGIYARLDIMMHYDNQLLEITFVGIYLHSSSGGILGPLPTRDERLL